MDITCIKKARSILTDMMLQKWFWTEAVSTINYLFTSDLTRYEVLYEVKSPKFK